MKKKRTPAFVTSDAVERGEYIAADQPTPGSTPYEQWELRVPDWKHLIDGLRSKLTEGELDRFDP